MREDLMEKKAGEQILFIANFTKQPTTNKKNKTSW